MDRRRLIATGVLGGGAKSPLLTGLVAYYKLDELTGVRADSANGLYPMSDAIGTTGYAVGKIGNGANFTGSSRLATAASAGLTSIDWTNGFTVAGWINPNVVQRNGLCVKGLDPYDWQIGSNGADDWRFVIIDSTSGTSTAVKTKTTTTGTWFFLCGRYNPATKKAEIRVDAESWKLGNALTNGPSNARNVLGIGVFSADRANAIADEVGVWSRYLSNDEVDTLYNGGSGNSHPF